MIITDVLASPTHSPNPDRAVNTDDAELGYEQKLDRSVGALASFAIGFATISVHHRGVHRL